jgi:ribosome-binding protein aMBF1 (putative translation factor)
MLPMRVASSCALHSFGQRTRVSPRLARKQPSERRRAQGPAGSGGV